MSAKAKSVALSSVVKKLLGDFKQSKGELGLSDEKFQSWYRTFAALSADKRAKTAAELIAVALRFERDGGDEAIRGTAQLYFLASAVLGQAAQAKGWSKKK